LQENADQKMPIICKKGLTATDEHEARMASRDRVDRCLGMMGLLYPNYTGGKIATIVGTPELSTWAMMLLGFAGLGFAGYRKAHSARTTLSAA
jgi:hypothetical protein